MLTDNRTHSVAKSTRRSVPKSPVWVGPLVEELRDLNADFDKTNQKFRRLIAAFEKHFKSSPKTLTAE